MARARTGGSTRSSGSSSSTSKRSTAKRSTAKRTASKARATSRGTKTGSASKRGTTSAKRSSASKTTSARARKTSGSVKRTAAASKRSTASRKRTAASRSAASSRGGGQSARRGTKEQLVESIATHLRKLKQNELKSLSDRLDQGTLRFSDLTLSGEGGFGFQEGTREEGGSGGSESRDGEDENVLERGADASRGLLDRAKGVIGG